MSGAGIVSRGTSAEADRCETSASGVRGAIATVSDGLAAVSNGPDSV